MGILAYLTAAMRNLPAEFAHDAAGLVLKNPSLVPDFRQKIDTWIQTRQVDRFSWTFLGRALPHPIGLAAGFDKNANLFAGLQKLGFCGFELGTVTPLPQPGNPKPRLFRLKQQQAIINRMGFNNCGLETFLHNFTTTRTISLRNKINDSLLGLNIGKNKATSLQDAKSDYVTILETLAKKTSPSMYEYIVINISSPNTPGLRDLSSHEFIASLAESARTLNLLDRVFIKLDPDMENDIFQKRIESIESLGFKGVILTNTHMVEKPHRGGLSGLPIQSLAFRKLDLAREVSPLKLQIISVGGVSTGVDIVERLRRGADLVQLYTAFIYQGPDVVFNLLKQIDAELENCGVQCLREINHRNAKVS